MVFIPIAGQSTGLVYGSAGAACNYSMAHWHLLEVLMPCVPATGGGVSCLCCNMVLKQGSSAELCCMLMLVCSVSTWFIRDGLIL